MTHCTDVKPLISVATYLDITSNVEIFQEVLGPMFTPIEGMGKESGQKGEPTLQMRGSKLIKFQQVKLQEMSDEVPTSATPRCAVLTVPEKKKKRKQRMHMCTHVLPIEQQLQPAPIGIASCARSNVVQARTLSNIV